MLTNNGIVSANSCGLRTNWRFKNSCDTRAEWITRAGLYSILFAGIPFLPNGGEASAFVVSQHEWSPRQSHFFLVFALLLQGAV